MAGWGTCILTKHYVVCRAGPTTKGDRLRFLGKTTLMKKFVALLLVLVTLSACTTAELNRTLATLAGGTLSNADIVSGLKEALDKGIAKGSDELSQVNGYFKSPYKILLPPEARKVTDKLQGVPGFSQLEETILEKINRGAEDAATRAKPIFLSAIKEMTISDALNILMGPNDAATSYLQRTTLEKLYAEFNPVIVTSLDKFNARQLWGDAVGKYNQLTIITGGDRVNDDLDDYVTRQALDGLFSMIAKEETNIRENIGARTTDLLKKVFAKQDNK